MDGACASGFVFLPRSFQLCSGSDYLFFCFSPSLGFCFGRWTINHFCPYSEPHWAFYFTRMDVVGWTQAFLNALFFRSVWASLCLYEILWSSLGLSRHAFSWWLNTYFLSCLRPSSSSSYSQPFSLSSVPLLFIRVFSAGVGSLRYRFLHSFLLQWKIHWWTRPILVAFWVLSCGVPLVTSHVSAFGVFNRACKQGSSWSWCSEWGVSGDCYTQGIGTLRKVQILLMMINPHQI